MADLIVAHLLGCPEETVTGHCSRRHRRAQDRRRRDHLGSSTYESIREALLGRLAALEAAKGVALSTDLDE
jgi:hypothetical protein